MESKTEKVLDKLYDNAKVCLYDNQCKEKALCF